MTKPQSEFERALNEAAEEYGLQVSKHQWERGPVNKINGEYREWDKRPNFPTQSAFRFGARWLLSNLDRIKEVRDLREALERHQAWHLQSKQIACENGFSYDLAAEYCDSDLCETTLNALANFDKLIAKEKK